jgi:hypothetical protein
MKDNFEIWDAVSMAWTEIGLEDTEYPKIAKKIKETHSNWEEVDLIIKKDVCGSFAFDTFLIFPCMLWMIMPDWGYDSDYLKERMAKWYSKPYYKHFLNPMRVLGYPMSLLMSASVRSELKRAFHNL